MSESHKVLYPDVVKDDKTACETPISSPERGMRKGDTAEEYLDEIASQSPSSEHATDSEDKNDYSNWQLRDIPEPSKNDVLFGRGGG